MDEDDYEEMLRARFRRTLVGLKRPLDQSGKDRHTGFRRTLVGLKPTAATVIPIAMAGFRRTLVGLKPVKCKEVDDD